MCSKINRYRMLGCLLLLLSMIPAAQAQDAPAEVLSVKVATYLVSVNRFSITDGTYNASFYLSFQCNRPCTEDEFLYDMPTASISMKDPVSSEDNYYEYFVQAEVSQNDINLSRFPFDRHHLTIVIEPKAPITEVVFQTWPEQTAIDPDLKVLGWDFDTNLTLEVRNKSYFGSDEPYSRYIFGIFLSNPPIVGLLKAIFPAMVFMLVSLSSSLLSDRATKLGIAGGILLTLVFHSLSTTGSLPSVGYAIYFDVFMLANYIFVLLQIGIDSYAIVLENRQKSPEYVSRFGRRGLLVAVLIWFALQGLIGYAFLWS